MLIYRISCLPTCDCLIVRAQNKINKTLLLESCPRAQEALVENKIARKRGLYRYMSFNIYIWFAGSYKEEA